jgi:hypothetical protein
MPGRADAIANTIMVWIFECLFLLIFSGRPAMAVRYVLAREKTLVTWDYLFPHGKMRYGLK